MKKKKFYVGVGIIGTVLVIIGLLAPSIPIDLVVSTKKAQGVLMSTGIITMLSGVVGYYSS